MSKNTYHQYLRQVPMFADLSEHELDQLERAVTDLTMSAGSVVFHEGAAAHEMVVVVEGTLEVTRGGEHIADIDSGGFAGELALLTRSSRNSTVTARTDVALLHIDGREFSSLLAEVPEIAVKMLPVVAARAIVNAEHH